MFIDNITIKSKLLFGNIITSVLVIILCTIAWRGINTMNTTTDMVTHTFKVIDHSHNLVNSMVDKETGLRGFAIGGEEDYLEPYYSGIELFKHNLELVKGLTSDNPAQQKRFDTVAEDARGWDKYAESIITLRKNIKEGEKANSMLKELILSGIGKQKMDALRAEVATGNYGVTGETLLDAMINMETGLRGFMLNREEHFLDPFVAGKSTAEQLFTSLSGSLLGDHAKKWIYGYAEKAIELVREANQFATITTLNAQLSEKQGKEYMDGIRAKVAKIVSIEEVLMGQRTSASNQASSVATTVVMFGGAVTVMASILFGLLVSASITGPINKVVAAAGQLAKGDLTFSMPKGANTETGNLQNALRDTRENLSDIIRNMTLASTSLAKASFSLKETTTSTSDGAQQQQIMADQVAVGMQEMACTVTEVATNAEAVATLADEASVDAKSGLQVVQSTISSIVTLEHEIKSTANRLGELAKETDNIGGILDVILGIADQTNLLALNAAIEAARAGDQGRGFAVVADEVRGLAQRTQNSTSEIQELIERLQHGTRDVVLSMEKSSTVVNSSVEDANRSGLAFTSITDGIEKIQQYSATNATACEQQSTTTEQINKNVQTVSVISKQSAQNAETMVEASGELAILAEELKKMVGQFTVRAA